MGMCMREVKYSMKTSSVKGVSRIISAHSSLHKTLWTVAVICFFGVSLLTVSTNIHQYLEYPKVVNVEEKLIDPTDPNGTVSFPTVIVCNTNQFSDNRSAFTANGIPLPTEYHQTVEKVTKCVNCSNEERKLIQIARRRLFTARGYYQYVGMHNMAKLVSKDLVIRCEIWFRSGSSFTSYPCDEFATNHSFVHTDAGLCYEYRPNPSINQSIIGYSFLLHLDSLKENMNNVFSPESAHPTALGAALYLSDPFTTPSVVADASIATAGALTIEYIKAVRIDRLSKPYSERECFDEDHFEKLQYNDRLYNYDVMSCFGQCFLDYVIRECNCTDLWLMHYPVTKPPTYEYCASLNHSSDQVLKNIACAEEMRGPAFGNCKERCKEPCKEIKYKLTSKTAKWPLPSQITSFYQNVIEKNPSLSQKYKKHLDTAKALDAGYGNVSDVAQLLASRVIENNFASAHIYLSDFYYTHYEAKPKITFAALISQLGGSLNLWSGITMMFIVEIIDLLLRLICRQSQEEKNDNIPVQHLTHIESNFGMV